MLLNKIWNEEQLLHYQSLSRDEQRDYFLWAYSNMVWFCLSSTETM
jgi:hypothetical protein